VGVDGVAKVTKYRITWGDGTSELVDSFPEARKVMALEKSATKRRGMRVTSVAV
jgi:hypothetical protein